MLRDIKNNLYLHAMPMITRRKLCAILDQNELWKILGEKHMQFSSFQIQEMEKNLKENDSPTHRLLKRYSDIGNHTVVTLFFLLRNMKQFIAMETIKHLVNKSYHKYIRIEVSQNSSNSNQRIKSSKILNVQSIEINASTLNTEDTSVSSILNICNIDKFASTITQINYNDLIVATNGWNENNRLGRGGFATVYKGKWQETDVAIKRLETRKATDSDKMKWEQSMIELKFLNAARHDNILPLYGYSVNGVEPCLVYQLMLGSSLEHRLSRRSSFKPLSWKQRYMIAQGIARGLQFLHRFREKPLIHGDIKPANILLDSSCNPKIGDFGLAREMPLSLNGSIEVSKIYGTQFYLPNDYLSGRILSTKVDTYSYGIVLYEIVTALKVKDSTREQPLLVHYMGMMFERDAPLIEFLDKFAPHDEEPNVVLPIASMLLRQGMQCTHPFAAQRPEMKSVLHSLESLNISI